MDPPSSENVSYLSYFDARLVAATSRAEHVVGLDPVGTLTHLRLFGELLAQYVTAREGAEESQLDRLRALTRAGLPSQPLQMLQALRRAGNRAARDGMGDEASAFVHLKIAWQLAMRSSARRAGGHCPSTCAGRVTGVA